MINTELLEKKIKTSGKKKGYLATKCNISRPYFYAKCIGTRSFTVEEVKILCTELGITSLKEKEAIFFA